MSHPYGRGRAQLQSSIFGLILAPTRFGRQPSIRLLVAWFAPQKRHPTLMDAKYNIAIADAKGER
jgi:hypothetical protein